MKTRSILILLTAFLCASNLCFGVTGHFGARQDSTAVKNALNTINIQYGQAFTKGDSSLFLNSYTADACIMPAGSPVICGHNAQLAFFKFAYRSGVRNIIFNTLGLYGLTDQFVTEQGAYEMFDANKNSIGKGKYLVVWKKFAGGWKMYRDMFSSDKK